MPLPFGAFLKVYLAADPELSRFATVVHELCLVKDFRAYQRIIFVEIAGRLVFGFMANELMESPQKAYLAYLEKSVPSGIGRTPTRVIEAYFKYLAFAHPNLELHIWADPPDPGKSYLFRLPPPAAAGASPSRTGEGLREWYTSTLQSAVKCSPKPFSYVIPLPQLPPFGKKSEDLVKSLFTTTKKLLEVVEEQFSAYFQNTVFVRMPRNRRHHHAYDFGLWEIATDVGFLDHKRDVRDKLDYTDPMRVATVTKAFLDGWKATYPFGYQCYGDDIPQALKEACLAVCRQTDPASAADETTAV